MPQKREFSFQHLKISAREAETNCNFEREKVLFSIIK